MVWSQVRHWAKKQDVFEHLGPQIERMCISIKSTVTAAQLPTLNDNSGFAKIFGQVIDASEDERIGISEILWEEGMRSLKEGICTGNAEILRKACLARETLCADTVENRLRAIEMKRAIVAFGEEQAKQNADTSQRLILALDKRYLASALDAQNHFEDALIFYQQALEIYRAVKTQDDDDAAAALNGSGVALYNLGRYQESISTYKQALNIRQRIWGEKHHGVARCHYNIGVSFSKLGDYTSSLKFFENDLRITTKIAGMQI
jgi:tetratricopeptide (TPR) repeat protein